MALKELKKISLIIGKISVTRRFSKPYTWVQVNGCTDVDRTVPEPDLRLQMSDPKIVKINFLSGHLELSGMMLANPLFKNTLHGVNVISFPFNVYIY